MGKRKNTLSNNNVQTTNDTSVDFRPNDETTLAVNKKLNSESSERTFSQTKFLPSPVSDKKSLVKMLTQAIHLHDSTMLEIIFTESMKESSIIDATVQGLSPLLAIPFLKQLHNAILTFPNRLVVFLPWISALLSIHSSLFLANPIKTELLKLIEVFESRISFRTEYEKMLGKLNFIINRIEVRLENSVAAGNDDFTPQQIYSELASEEESTSGLEEKDESNGAGTSLSEEENSTSKEEDFSSDETEEDLSIKDDFDESCEEEEEEDGDNDGQDDENSTTEEEES